MNENVVHLPDPEIISALRRAIAAGHNYALCIDAGDAMLTAHNVDPEIPGTTSARAVARMLERHARALRASE